MAAIDLLALQKCRGGMNVSLLWSMYIVMLIILTAWSMSGS